MTFEEIDGVKIICKHCKNDDVTLLETVKDNPAEIIIRCEVCSKETRYERASTD